MDVSQQRKAACSEEERQLWVPWWVEPFGRGGWSQSVDGDDQEGRERVRKGKVPVPAVSGAAWMLTTDWMVGYPIELSAGWTVRSVYPISGTYLENQ